MPATRTIGEVSVVVCNYNGAAYIADCLDSILALEGVGEVLVVDDGSELHDDLVLLGRYLEAMRARSHTAHR